MLKQSEINSQNDLKSRKPLVYEKVIKFGEKFSKNEPYPTIQLQYNYICNMKCTHCSISDFRFSPENKDKHKLSIKDIKNIAQQADALGISQFDITGGEPLLFKELDAIIEAIDPSKFYIQCDSNGWYLTDEKAKHLKEIGVDKINLGLDSLDEISHDAFRKSPGAWKRAMASIDSTLKAGMTSQIATVVSKKRLYSEEFIQFLEFAKSKNTIVGVCWPFPTGKLADTNLELITQAEIDYLNTLTTEYKVYDHLSKTFGRDIGCTVVKRLISITQFGEVMPCPWMFFSLGNVLNTPLKNILDKGMKYFGHYISNCPIVMDKSFIEKYVVPTYGLSSPIPIENILPLDWAKK
jgi:MoaA/NifB/PqqE/SkfB family radical SAM enzyme